jgi:hypothetical protein
MTVWVAIDAFWSGHAVFFMACDHPMLKDVEKHACWVISAIAQARKQPCRLGGLSQTPLPSNYYDEAT